MTRSNSNVQPMSYVHDRCCNKYSLLGSSPTTVLDRMVEAPGNLNSCMRSANRIIKPQEKQLQNCRVCFFSVKNFRQRALCFSTFSLSFFWYKTTKGRISFTVTLISRLPCTAQAYSPQNFKLFKISLWI